MGILKKISPKKNPCGKEAGAEVETSVPKYKDNFDSQFQMHITRLFGNLCLKAGRSFQLPLFVYV